MSYKTPLDRLVYVYNLPPDKSNDYMKEFMTQGKWRVASFNTVYDRVTNLSKGYGICEYMDARDVDRAVATLDRYRFSANCVINVRRGTEVQQQQQQHQHYQQQYASNMMNKSHKSMNLPKKTKIHRKTIDEVTRCVNELSQTEKRDILTEMKTLIKKNEDQTRTLLENNPQLAQALLLIQIQFGLVTADDVKALTETVNNDIVFPNYINENDNPINNNNSNNNSNNNANTSNDSNNNAIDSDITMGRKEMSPILEETNNINNNSNNNNNNGNSNNDKTNSNDNDIEMNGSNTNAKDEKESELNENKTETESETVTAAQTETETNKMNNKTNGKTETNKDEGGSEEEEGSEDNDNENESEDNENEDDSESEDEDGSEDDDEEEDEEDHKTAVREFVKTKFSSLAPNMADTVVQLILLPDDQIPKLPKEHQARVAKFKKMFNDYSNSN